MSGIPPGEKYESIPAVHFAGGRNAITRYALPLAFALAMVGLAAMVCTPSAPPPAAAPIAPYVTIDSLLTASASEAGRSSAVPDALPVASESAAQHAEAVAVLFPRDAYSSSTAAATASATPHQLIAPEPAGDLQALALEAGWPQHRLDELVAVAWCESRFYSDRVGAAGELGPMQIHPVHRQMVAEMGYAWSEVADPLVNLVIAHRVFLDAGGWRPWSCKP